MHRFYVSPEASREDPLVLSPRESRHAAQVMRLRRGERVIVLNGVGVEFLCELAESRRDFVKAKVLQRQLQSPLPYRISLVQAIPKGRTMDLIVQRATELGVHRIIPLLSERTVPDFDEETSAAKRERWQSTAIEAIKQCGSAWLPSIESPCTVPALLAKGVTGQEGVSLVASLQEGAGHLREWLGQEDAAATWRWVTVWVGPEGDFTPAEMAAIRAAGALPISLGRSVLRSETAALYALATVKYELEWLWRFGGPICD